MQVFDIVGLDFLERTLREGERMQSSTFPTRSPTRPRTACRLGRHHPKALYSEAA
jgi:hypothetical protein